MGKEHPSLYMFLEELKKEQSDTESMLRDLGLGKRIRKGQDPKRRRKENAIFTLVSKYEEYVNNQDVMTYLKSIGYNIRLSK